MQRLVSVCLPVFNGEQILALAIESVLAQSYGNLELLIIDDVSTDSSQSVIEDYLRKDKRVRYWRNSERQGIFACYNQCMQRAEGVFIKPFQQSALLEPTMIEQCVKRFYLAPGLALVAVSCRFFTDMQAIPKNKSPYGAADFVPPDRHLSGVEVARYSLSPLGNFIGLPSAVMFLASLVGEGFDPAFEYLGDFEYWLRIMLDGYFHYVPDDLVSVSQTASSQFMRASKPPVLARDAIHFALKHRWLLESFGISRDQFITGAGPFLSRLVFA